MASLSRSHRKCAFARRCERVGVCALERRGCTRQSSAPIHRFSLGTLATIFMMGSVAVVAVNCKSLQQDGDPSPSEDVAVAPARSPPDDEAPPLTTPPKMSPSTGSRGAPANGGGLLTGEGKMKTLQHFLERLPTQSVSTRHAAQFECELDERSGASQVVWVKLRPGGARAANGTRAPKDDDVTLISLNQRVISRERRFRVVRQPPLKWTLHVDPVQPDDHRAYFLCQASVASGSQRTDEPSSRFVGGAKLEVLVPPSIVEPDTSASLVLANEWEPLLLRCKVSAGARSHLEWKREDGRPVEALEQRSWHEESTGSGQPVSLDASELLLGPVRRHQAGAYLCIASNGVPPGVSKRVGVVVVKCRSEANVSLALEEPCEAAAAASTVATSSSSSTSTQAPATGGPRARAGAAQKSAARDRHAQERAPDKRRILGAANRAAPNRNSDPTGSAGQVVGWSSAGVAGRQPANRANANNSAARPNLNGAAAIASLIWATVTAAFAGCAIITALAPSSLRARSAASL